MADPEAILARIRSYGANLVLESGEMRLVRGNKLPPQAVQFVQTHSKMLADHLRQSESDAIEERAAVIEFDGGAPREWAEQFARYLYRSRPAGADEQEWSWFHNVCGRMIDEAPRRTAA